MRSTEVADWPFADGSFFAATSVIAGVTPKRALCRKVITDGNRLNLTKSFLKDSTAP